MRILFMGTPAIAIPVLEGLFDLGHSVVGVVTQPDKLAGRGRGKRVPPIKEVALARGLPVLQPPSLRKPEALVQVKALAADVIVVAAYGKILPQELLEAPPKGCLNIHPSLLPRHRGPSPVATAVLEGDELTGVSIIVMNEGIDAGPLVAQCRRPMGPEDTTGELTELLFRKGAELLKKVLPGYLSGEARPFPQAEDGASYTRMLCKDDGRLDWQQDAEALGRRLRAFTPWPGCHTCWNGRLLKVIMAKPLPMEEGHPESPGKVIVLPEQGGRVGVMAGRGVLALCRVQLEGKRSVDGVEFVRGHRDFIGATLPN